MKPAALRCLPAFFFLMSAGFLLSDNPMQSEDTPEFHYSPGLDATAVEAVVAGIADSEVLRKMEKLAGDEFLGREYGTEYGRRAAEYLAEELKSYGYAAPLAENTSFIQDIPKETYYGYGGGQNVVAVLPGSDPELAKKYVVLCAHYDHLGFRDVPVRQKKLDDAENPAPDTPPKTRRVVYYGADDNASSVVILLETARAMKQLPATPRHSVLFLFVDGEEKGLLGSRYWAEHPTVPREDVEVVLTFDMNGYLNEKSQLYLFATRTGEHLEQWLRLGNTDPQEPLELVFPWSIMARSDHAAFLPYKIPVVMGVTGISPVYHTPRDTTENINVHGITRIARFLTRTVVQMACADKITSYRSQWRREKCPVEDESAGFFQQHSTD